MILGSIQSIEGLFGWFDEKSPRTLEIISLELMKLMLVACYRDDSMN